MAKSIIDNTKECFICKNPRVQQHHIYKGNKCRKIADQEGLWVWLCRYHHNQVHHDREVDLTLMRLGQQEYEKTHTREEFREKFIKSYL